MQCPRCKFENMPGLTTCFQCGSVLEAGRVMIDVHPPRAPRWARPFRATRRWMRRNLYNETMAAAGDAIDRAARKMGKTVGYAGKGGLDLLASLVLSLVPGLNHMVRGRFKEVRFFCLAWLILMGGGVFGYESSMGLFLIGLAVGIHAWITLQGLDMLGSEQGFSHRLGTLFAGIACCGLLYWYIAGRITHYFPGGWMPYDFAYQNVQQGDFLMGRLYSPEKGILPRGTLILAEVQQVPNYGHGFGDYYVETIGQIIGLPGETVSVEKNTFYIRGKSLDAKRFPVPAWLNEIQISMPVPKNCYLVFTAYGINAHGMNLNQATDMIRQACTVEWGHIKGRMTMRWLPLARRGFLKELQ